MPVVVVVGGGVIGLSCAWRLATAGHQVTVLDAAPGAVEASWAAAGMLAPHHELTQADPLWAFGVESLGMWPTFARELGGDLALDHHQRGGLVPVLSAEDRVTVTAQQRHLERSGVATRWLSRAELVRLAPVSDVVEGALLIPGGQVDPRSLLTAVQAACTGAGVAVRYGVRVRRVSQDHIAMETSERLACEQVVIASGAWTPALAGASGLALVGEPVKGQMVRLAAPDGLLTHFVHSHHAYLVPRREAGLVVGSTMVESGFDRTQDAAAIDRLVANARHLLPSLERCPVVESWTGLRPRLRGGRPLIARIHPWLIVATGHFRNGILLAPATAAAVAALVAGHAPSQAAAVFAEGGDEATRPVSSRSSTPVGER